MSYRDHRDALVEKLNAELVAVRNENARLKAELAKAKRSANKAEAAQRAAETLRNEVSRLTLELSALNEPLQPFPRRHSKTPGCVQPMRQTMPEHGSLTGDARRSWNEFSDWLKSRLNDEEPTFGE